MLVPSLTTCRTAGACTSGWCLLKHCLYDLLGDVDAASQEQFQVAQFAIELGSTSVLRTITELVSQGCLLIRDLLFLGELAALDWPLTIP